MLIDKEGGTGDMYEVSSSLYFAFSAFNLARFLSVAYSVLLFNFTVRR